MIYSTGEYLLLLALLLTSVMVGAVYVKLRRFDQKHRQLVADVRQATAALDAAYQGFGSLTFEAQETARELSAALTEARALLDPQGERGAAPRADRN